MEQVPYETLVPLIIALPLAGFVFSVFFGRRLQAAFGRTVAVLVPLGVVIASWVVAMVVVAAGEATVGLAIVMAIYRNRRTPLVDEYDAMRQ
jgi:NADH:ubiquinone oxidoreductase subunit K